MDKVVFKIIILFLVVIIGNLFYQLVLVKPEIKNNIVIGKEFKINLDEAMGFKDIEHTTFEVTQMGASLNGYVFKYELNSKGKIFTQDNIDESNYVVTLGETNYKTYANVTISRK